MLDSRWSIRGRMINLWNFVLTTELANGTQFLQAQPGGQLYVVLGLTSETLPVSRTSRGGERWHSYFHTVYGFAEHELPARFCYDSLRHYLISNGQRIELRRFAAFDTLTHTAYLSQYNGRLWKVTDENTIEAAPNGEDNVFFADDDDGQPVEPDVGNHGLLIERLTSINFASQGLSGITPDQQKMAMTVWLFMLAFPDLMPTKPLLLIEGTQGSGKTASIQLVQLALQGKRRMMMLSRNKEDDFGVVLLRAPIAIFDNTDSYIEWVPDAVCAYATDGTWTKRRLFTDDDSFVIKPQSFIAIASKNPASFRREDVADRCIILRLERRAAFRAMKRLHAQIMTDRPRLFGEYLWYVGRICRELRETIEDEALEEVHRMADFAAFSRAIGRVLEWDDAVVTEMLCALQGERDAFINEEDPLIEVMRRWIAYRPRMGPSSVGRLLSSHDLNTELESIAQASGIPWKHTSRSLSQKIRSPHVEREFHIETHVIAGSKAYKIWRLTDPRLEVITGGEVVGQIETE